MRRYRRRDYDLPPAQYAGGIGAPASAAGAPRPKRPSDAGLAQADRELALADRYQYQVINDNMDQAVREICEILTNQWERSQND